MNSTNLKEQFMDSEEKYNDLLKLAETIQTYITEHDCPKLSMDISHLNIFDAGKITALWSAYHWAKYPDGEITLKTDSEGIKTLTNSINLGNIKLVNAQ